MANYDFQLKKWNWLPSENRTSNDTVFFFASITELPSPKALFALLLSENPGSKRSELHIEAEKSITPVIPVSNEVLVLNTFEDNTGMWKAGDQFVGAQVSTDTKSTPDGSKALKITGTNHGGNFSVTAVDKSFDVRDYPLLSFDYKVEPGVNTDFHLLINNRWYNLGFTGDTADFSHSDVNIANLGRFDNIPADNQWHSTSINLYELIRLKTKHTRVDAIRMADWQPGGYMKLDFGNNSRSASYYIDNFKLTSGPKYEIPEILHVDDFN